MPMDKYIELPHNDLLRELIVELLTDPAKTRDLSDRLATTENYQKDYKFRVVVDLTKAMLLSLFGDYKKAIPLCNDVLERANTYEMWEAVSTAWNTLGNIYYSLGIYERSVECFFQAINNDKAHKIHFMSASSYNYIALIYLKFKEGDKAQEYFKLAFDSLEDAGEDQPRYLSKKVSYVSNIALELTQAGSLEAAQMLLDELEEFDFSAIDFNALFDYEFAVMNYCFYVGNLPLAKVAYRKCRESIASEKSAELLTLLVSYVELCEKVKLPFEAYHSEIEEIGELSKHKNASYGVWLHYRLRNYFLSIGDLEGYQASTEKYIKALEKESVEHRSQKLNSVQMITSLIKENESIRKINSKNKELKMIAMEADKRKNELQDAYQRIETINKLGSKITSSLDIKEVVEAIHYIIKENMPVDVFSLCVVNKQEHLFETLLHYFEGEMQPNFNVEMDDPTSIYSVCYKEKRIITSKESVFIERIKMQRIARSDTAPSFIPSAIFLPLMVKEEVIGICTIQYNQSDVYDEKQGKFLEALSPYLSIALNNALKSWELEKEIESHLATRYKLEKANRRLERISSLDGLTSINGRRVFDTKIIELIRAAKKLNTSISVLMIDIDNFKLYNDNYGHLEGDEILKKVAKIFRKNMDEAAGLSARFGGEEFIGACLGLDGEKSEELGNKIREDIYNLGIPHTATSFGVLTISVGVAVAKNIDCLDKSIIMKVADECLYKAKNTGKNKVITEIL